MKGDAPLKESSSRIWSWTCLWCLWGCTAAAEEIITVCILLSGHTPCTAAVHVSLVKVCVCLCVCERARVKTDLRTICAAATSDGHRVVLRRRVPPCTHTHTHTHYYQGGWAYRECAQGDFWLENMQLIYYVGLVRTQCAYAGVSEHTDA